jgi:hypothetical protein
MADNDDVICWSIYAFFVWFGIVALIANLLNDPSAVILLAAPFVPIGIFLFVRWINRRSDPRHAKRPPDPP